MADFDYEAVVIGSGFGGSVSAYHLAEKFKERVLVLERGRAYAPGDFPRTPAEIQRNFWDPSEGLYGLYNIWSFDNFGALVSSGLGGGSLIYANVLLRKEPETFEQNEHEHWPIDAATLEPHYTAVEEMLGAQPYPLEVAPYSRTPKTLAMREAGARIGADFGLPPLAVSFSKGKPAQAQPGVEIKGAPRSFHEQPHPRLTCVLTGECNLGCNYGSKNTLDLNYLGEAKYRGAEIRTCCEASWIAPRAEAGYQVAFLDHSHLARSQTPRRGLREQLVTTKRLVLSAGTFGSTFLLLKCAQEFPRISDSALGVGFSGNGDLLTFLIKARKGRRPRVLEPSYGPVITSYIRRPPDRAKGRRGHYVEDAGYPYLVSWLTELASVPWYVRRYTQFRRRRLFDRLISETAETDLGAEFSKLVGEATLSSSSMPMLGMGRDVPDGRLLLDDRGRLTTTWTLETSRPYFAELESTAQAIADALGAKFQDSRLRGITKLVTVHPLGGLRMGSEASRAVVDSYGEVFGYPGFFVADGSVMPGPVGPNPALTIAALADRFSERMLQ